MATGCNRTAIFPPGSSDILVIDKVHYFKYIISLWPFQLSGAI